MGYLELPTKRRSRYRYGLGVASDAYTQGTWLSPSQVPAKYRMSDAQLVAAPESFGRLGAASDAYTQGTWLSPKQVPKWERESDAQLIAAPESFGRLRGLRGLGDDPMMICCPGDTIEHPASYCRTEVCEAPLVTPSTRVATAQDMIYCCPGDTAMRTRAQCALVECAPAMASPTAAPAVTALPYEEYVTSLPELVPDRSAEFAERRAAVEARSAELQAQIASMRSGLPAPVRAPAAKRPAGTPALSISPPPKGNTLLVIAALGGAVLLLGYLSKKGK